MHAGTISSHPSETAAKGTFTISIKRDGLVSSHMHAVMRPGMTLRFRGVGGTFTPVPDSTAPALLVAGGIGKHHWCWQRLQRPQVMCHACLILDVSQMICCCIVNHQVDVDAMLEEHNHIGDNLFDDFSREDCMHVETKLETTWHLHSVRPAPATHPPRAMLLV